MQQAVKITKRIWDWRWGEWGNDSESNKKMFWKEVKRAKKGGPARDEMIKDVNG